MANHYVSQLGAGTADGSSAANARPLTWLNSASNWGAGPNKVAPGDRVRLVGLLVTPITINGSGSAGNEIVIGFEPGAKMSAPFWSSSAINGTSRHYITIDGGAIGTIGGLNGSSVGSNGIIECTDNGTALGNQVSCGGVSFNNSSHIMVQGLVIRNIFVREIGPSTLKYGSCVGNTGSAADYTDYTVRNCILSHAATGIHFDYNQTNARYLFEDNTITNTNWGIGGGNRGDESYLDGIIVRRNRIHSFENWDGTDGPSQGAMHHNGFYVWGISGSSRPDNVEVYDNVFGPGWGGHTTGGFFTACNSAVRAIAYNNIFVGESDAPTNGHVTVGVGDGSLIRIYNNTFAGSAAGVAINVGGNRSSFFIDNSDPVNPTAFATHIHNNLSVNKTFAFLSYGVIATEIDRNLVYNPPSGQAYATGSGGSSNFKTFGQWQALGYDTNGVYGSDPLLSSAYRLSAGSPAIGAGKNLISFLTKDLAGVNRPALGAWDVGAYAYGGTSSGDAAPAPPEPPITPTPPPSSGSDGLTISFVNKTTPKANSYHWDFGDGNESTEKNPTHTYEDYGTYAVVLTVVCGSRTSTRTISVSVQEPPDNPPVPIMPIVTGISYMGFLQWHGFYPFIQTDFFLPERYLLKSASGRNRLTIDSGYPTQESGVAADNNWDGSIVVNYLDGSTTGEITNTRIYPVGIICAGSSYAYPPPGSSIEETWTGYQELTFEYHYLTGVDVQPVTRTWTSNQGPPPGYLVSYCGAGMGGIRGDTIIESLTNRMTLGQAAEAGGATEVPTQLASEIDTYGSGLADGLATQLTITWPVPASESKFVAEVTFLITPTGGGTPTIYTKTIYQDVTVGELATVIFDVPMLVGHRVEYQSALFYFVNFVGDDFERLISPLETYFGDSENKFVISQEWEEKPLFLVSEPSLSSNSFEDDLEGLVEFVSNGSYWGGSLIASSASNTEAASDFDNLDSGSLLFFGSGYGWSLFGFFSKTISEFSWDDFENYASGSISELNEYSDPFQPGGQWAGPGLCVIGTYIMPRDSFETYTSGAFSNWDEGEEWSGTGSFLIT